MTQAAEMSACHPFRSEKARDQYLSRYDKLAESWPIPSETAMVETSAGQTFVRVSGPPDAAPLVLLPGFGCNSLSWLPVIEVLSADFRTYAVDHIYDNGRSVAARAVTTRHDHMQWLDELLGELVPGRQANLMGVSRGGYLAAEYALHDPDRVCVAVLLAPAGVVLSASRGFVARFPLLLVRSRRTYGAYFRWLMPDWAQSDGRTRAQLDEMVDDMVLATQCFKVRRPPDAEGHDVFDDAELASLEGRALYVVGENERFCSAEDALHRLKAVAPGIATATISNAGHDLLAVQGDVVVKHVLEFLNDRERRTEQAHPADGLEVVG